MQQTKPVKAWAHSVYLQCVYICGCAGLPCPGSSHASPTQLPRHAPHKLRLTLTTMLFLRVADYCNNSSLALGFNGTVAQRARYLQVRPLLKAVRCIRIAECPWPFGASHRQLDPFGGSLAPPLNDDPLRFRVFVAGSRDRHSRAPAAAPPFAVEEGAACAAVLWKLVCRVVLSGHDFESFGQLLR